jgi:hypothetical protein
VLLAVPGCIGYRVGNASLYAPDVHTVYVPVFESESFRRNLGERLTEAVVKQIEANTPYKVVGSPQADSVLSGRIVAEGKHVIVEDRFDQPREVESRMVVQVRWVDRRGDLIGQEMATPVPSDILELTAHGTFVPEFGQSGATAQQDALNRLARQIVAQMEVPW